MILTDVSTMLIEAAQNNKLAWCKDLIRLGACVNAKDDLGFSALHHAAEQGNRKVCQLLLESGSDVEAITPADFTALHLALVRERKHVSRLLVELGGANVQKPNGNGQTPLHLAAANGDDDLCRRLVRHGANEDALNRCRWKPIHLAAVNGHTAVLGFFIDECGQELDQSSDTVASLLELAVGWNRPEASAFLAERLHSIATQTAVDRALAPYLDAVSKKSSARSSALL